MKKPVIFLAAFAMASITICALFPPRQDEGNHRRLSRGFLFSNTDKVILSTEPNGGITFTYGEIDGSRLAAECIFVLAACACTAATIHLLKEKA